MIQTNVVSLAWALQALSVVSHPESEPVTDTELRDHLRVEETISADYLQRLARTARRVVERYTNRCWAEQILKVECQVRRPVLPLPLSFPLRNIEAVEYWDVNGNAADISPSLYTLALGVVPVTVDLSAAPDAYRYTVRYRAGDSAAPPDDVRHAILVLAKWALENTDGTMPETRYRVTGPADVPPMVAMLLEPYRLETFTW